MENSDWYVKWPSGVRGPLSWTQLQEVGDSGKLEPHILVRSGQNGKWIEARHVEGLEIEDRDPEAEPTAANPDNVGIPASKLTPVVFLGIALVTAWSPQLVIMVIGIVFFVTVILAIPSQSLLNLVSARTRLAPLWLARESVRLESQLELDRAIWVLGFAVVTGGLAFVMTILAGSTSLTDILASGGYAAAAGGLLLVLLFLMGQTAEEQFASQVLETQKQAAVYQAEREQAAEDRRQAETERMQREAEARQAETERMQREAEARQTEAERMQREAKAQLAATPQLPPGAEVASDGSCWYCRQPHSQPIQCPYCHMLT